MPRHLRQPRSSVKEHIESQLADGRKLAHEYVGNEPSYRNLEGRLRSWRERSVLLLEACCSSDDEAKALRQACTLPPASGTLDARIPALKAAAQAGVAELECLLARLDLYPEPPSMPRAEPGPNPAAVAPRSKRIFIVHGHDELNLLLLQNFLKELGLQPVVLIYGPKGGRTLIEMLEEEGKEVGFAFILATADDLGYLAADQDKPAKERPEERRARQNVIFELGFFVGLLTRRRIACLTSGGTKLPSDLAGLAVIPFDKRISEVQESIRQELRKAGYELPG